MVPQAITDALNGAITTAQTIQGSVPGGIVLGQDDVNTILTQIGAIQNSLNATATALASLTAPTP